MRLAAWMLVLACASLPAVAVETLVWAESPADLPQGDLDGVAVTSGGRLFLAPILERHGGSVSEAMSAQVWSVENDALGNVYLGTGPDGKIIRVDPGGRETVLFRVDEPMVTALEILPSGELLAGTAPEGRIYRIRPGGDGELWVETGERYVWDLESTPGGRVFAATGEHGILLEIDERGDFETLFDSSEAHLVALHAMAGGGVLAGGGSRGLVYQIDAQGHALVLHDDALPEVTGLDVLADGTVVAALLAPPPSAPRKPAVKIRLPEAVAIGAASGQVEELEDRPGPTLEGTIEGLPVVEADGEEKIRGRVIRIRSEGVVEEIWRSPTDAPYAITLDTDDRVLIGTGEPARIYRAETDGDVSLLATLREGQVTGLLRFRDDVVLATSNPGASYRLDWDSDQSGIYLSRAFDAGASARWGRIRWRYGGPLGSVEFFTRTGNSEDPDATWSGWSPVLADPSGSRIVNPDGRYIQWRLRINGSRAQDIWVSGVEVSYLPFNRPPRIRDLTVDGPRSTAVSRAATFTWRQSDPDGDPIESRLQVRTPGASQWNESGEWKVVAEDGEPAGRSDGWRAGKGTWSVSSVPEGPYEVRLELSDQASNFPGEGGSVSVEPGWVLAVDRTPPVIVVTAGGGDVAEVRVEDALSIVVRLEVRVDGRGSYLAAPADGVCDSREETYRVVVPPGLPDGAVSVKAVDAAGNEAEQVL